MIFINEKKSKKLLLGIDLGTTYSLASLKKKDSVIFLLDDEKRYLLPSVVHYKKNSILVGWDAIQKAVKDPLNTISSVKRLIGRSIEFIKKEFPILPYIIEDDKKQGIILHTNAGPITPIKVSSDILMSLKERAMHLFKKEIDASIITVPAYFNNLQREATKKAAYLAKINLIRLLNEPTAAALAYGLQKKKQGIVLVYDLGGGTFDVSILKLAKGIFEVLATSGDSNLGGDDFDSSLSKYIYEKSNLLNDCSDFFQSLLLETAKKIKLKLTECDHVKVNFFNWNGYITRIEFNALILNFINKTLLICSNLLKEVDLPIDKIEEVIMVGGSTRIPLVREEVARFFKKNLLSSINPDQTVAMGAAIQVNMLMSKKDIKKKTILLDVTPLSLGIEVMGGFVEKIIFRNSPLPISKSKEFTTCKDNQTSILIHVLQGERELVKDCISLGRFVLKKITPQKAGSVRILVTFKIDNNGLIDISVSESSSNQEKKIKIDNSQIFQKINVSKIIKNSLKYSKDDYYFRIKEEKRIESINVLKILNKALKKDKKLITENELKKIEYARKNLKKSLKEDDFFSIKINLKRLEEASKNFFSLQLKDAINDFSIKNISKEII